MKCLELFDISARLSQEITDWSPLYNKVTKVVDHRTVEITRSATPVHAGDFWAEEPCDLFLTTEQRARIHLQYHRSKDIYGNVLAFVCALKELCDSGIPLYHEGVPVIDLWVLSTAEFDVSDVFDGKVLWLTDPISRYTLPSVSTHENMDTLRGLGPEVCRNIGLIPPEVDEVGAQLRTSHPEAYQGTMPYLWVAAITEDERLGGGKGRRMVHIDICAAAFDEDAIQEYNGLIASLKMFTTPEYKLVTTANLERAVRSQVFSKRKLIIEPCAQSTDGRWQFPMLHFIPFSVRHLRCFDKMDGSHIEMTPVDYFVSQNNHLLPGDIDEWFKLVTRLRHDIMGQVPVGARVWICNLEKRLELNGASCRVLKPLHSLTTRKLKKSRIAVCVSTVDNPVRLTTRCLRLTTTKQYKSLEDFVTEAEDMSSSFTTKEEDMRNMSKQDEGALEKARSEDPNLQLAFEILTTGKLTILCYANPTFVMGIRKILSPPLERNLSTLYARMLGNGLEVAFHPQAEEAFKILKLIRTAKQKFFEREPSSMRGDGSVLLDEGSDFHQIMERVGEKIASVDGLKKVFELMHQHKFFPIPIRERKLRLHLDGEIFLNSVS